MTELDPAEKTQVLVLGTFHLGKPEQVPMLESLLRRLRRFAPQHVAVEAIPSAVLQFMLARAPEYDEVLQTFAAERLEMGKRIQQELGLSTVQAEEALRHENPKGAWLILLLLATYDLFSAALQWSYLRDTPGHSVPAEIGAELSRVLSLPSERVSIGVRLARDLGLQRLGQIDDHTDYSTDFQIASQRLEPELEATNVQEHVNQQPVMLKSRRIYQKTYAAGDLLPYYIYLNSPDYSRDVAELEVGTYLRLKLASGLDRTKAAQWELRNLNMAAHIRRVTALCPGERVLVVVGSSHKPFLERHLKPLADLQLVQLRDLK